MKHKAKKSQKIAEAVFRGKKNPYKFEVFPLEIEFQESPAVFVISHRKVDKLGKGHHKMICIGQTESLPGELKKHKKSKCFKQNKANVIAVLHEENEKNRLKIEEDLRLAHRIPCFHQQ